MVSSSNIILLLVSVVLLCGDRSAATSELENAKNNMNIILKVNLATMHRLPNIDLARLQRIAKSLVKVGETVAEDDKQYMEEEFAKFPRNARRCPVRTVADKNITRQVMNAMQRYGSDWATRL